jgi:hypothetical protein
MTRPPPKDRHELAKAQHRYWELRHAEAVAAFEEYRDNLKQQAFANARRSLPPPSGKKLDHLRDLRNQVRLCRDRVLAFAAKVAKTEPQEVRRRRLLKEAEAADRDGPYLNGRPIRSRAEWAESHRAFDAALGSIKP